MNSLSRCPYERLLSEPGLLAPPQVKLIMPWFFNLQLGQGDDRDLGFEPAGGFGMGTTLYQLLFVSSPLLTITPPSVRRSASGNSCPSDATVNRHSGIAHFLDCVWRGHYSSV